MHCLEFKVRGTICGTNMFSDESFKVELNLKEANTVKIACIAALGCFIDADDINKIASEIVAKLMRINRTNDRAVEILSMPLYYNGCGSLRVLAKVV